MLQNGEINERFGVYKSICCGAAILITEGATFSHCPSHPRLTTIWQPLHRGGRTLRDRSLARSSIPLIQPLSPSIKKVNLQWHVLQVRPRFERIVILRLGERGLKAYVPLRQTNGTYSIELPLFPGYVFCKCDETRVSSLWDIPGVLARVRGNDGTDVVPEQQITDLRRILAAGLRVQQFPFIEQGRIVMVEDGPLSGVTGILEQRADNRRLLVLSIQLIRRSIAVKINRDSRISLMSQITDKKKSKSKPAA